MRTPIYVAAAMATVLALGATGCSTLEDLMGARETAEKATENPVKAAAEERGDDGSNATCCVNGAFYDCPNAPAATQCLGQPFDLASCMGNCTGTDGSCENECAEKYGPDPSSCQRNPSGDASCKRD